MQAFLQVTFSGLVTGSVYGLLALGLVLIYRTTGVLNFAYSALSTFGACFLLLDQPSLGLAPSIVDTVFKVIARLNREQQLTVVLVEQNARMALSIVTSAYVLQGGIGGAAWRDR